MDVEKPVIPCQPADPDTVVLTEKKISLVCSICGSKFHSPRALPCLHTYCKTCLSSYIQTYLSETNKSFFPCPECQQDTQPIDPTRPIVEWADGFPENFFLIDMNIDALNNTPVATEKSYRQKSIRTSETRVPRLSFSDTDICNNSVITRVFDKTGLKEVSLNENEEKVLPSSPKVDEETVVLEKAPEKQTPPGDVIKVGEETVVLEKAAENQTPRGDAIKVGEETVVLEKVAENQTLPQDENRKIEQNTIKMPTTTENVIENNVKENNNGLFLPLEHTFTATIPGVERPSVLNNALILPSGDVLGVDVKNRHVKKFSKSGKLTGLLRLMSEPGDIAYLPEGEALVTLPQKYEIITFDPDESLEIIDHIPTPRKYTSIAVGQPEKLVATHCVNNFWCIDVLSYAGYILYSIQRNCMGRPMGLAISPNFDIIVSDALEQSLLSYKWSGTLNFLYKPDSEESDEYLEEPGSVCCGLDGSIYLADTKNNRIIHMSATGQFKKILLDVTDGLSRPMGLYFSNDSKLLVTQADGVVKIFGF
ncbi:tripartite motif-containing protein 45-like, partial [Argonauta hians]